MEDYIKVGKWVINPKYITSARDFQDEDDESKPHIAIWISADDHVQLGEPCPFCGAKLTRETLRPARL